nr:hypothetical protein [uncultured Undibacterium sp.]
MFHLYSANRIHWQRWRLLFFCFALLISAHVSAADFLSQQKQYAYSADMPWLASIQGGRGGQVLRVTNLYKEGPGSLRAALETKGPRIVVFEVGGVIDLERSVLQVTEPYLTILGQTAPAPGVTLIRGGINIRASQTIIQHLRVRTGADGQSKASGWEVDGINISAAHHVLIDHCSISWAIDENMSASGPRFKGETPDDWRNGTSHHIMFSNNIAAEGLAESSHSKGEHSKGSLVHDNVTQIVFYRNIWAHNVERNPLLKGGVQASVVNNLIYNPRAKAIHYNLMALEWGEHAYQLGKLNVVGNVMRGGLSTKKGLPLVSLGGDGDLAYFEKDNIAVDQFGVPLPMLGRYGQTRAQLLVKEAPIEWPEGLLTMPAKDVETELLRYAGARPWDRDADDVRILFYIAEGRGTIINDEREVSSYPKVKITQAAFNEQGWDMVNGIPKAALR